MAVQETSTEVKAKIIFDEANLAFAETAQRKDSAENRTQDGSGLNDQNMEGEFDETDFLKIRELQLEAAKICDANPDLEQKTSDNFQAVTADNADQMMKEALEDSSVRDLARISVTIFMLRFPTVQSYMNKGHPLVLAVDEYMLENSTAQNWHDYNNIAQEMNWI